MARVTVEDCIQKVKNRFELVLMAAERTKDLEKGAAPTVMRDNDKSTIIALREIADETISLEGLKKLAKRGLVEDSDISQENNELSSDENIFNIDADENYEDEDDDDIDDDEIEEDIETDEAVDSED